MDIKTLASESVAFICPRDLIVRVPPLQFFCSDSMIGSSKALKREIHNTKYSLLLHCDMYIPKACSRNFLSIAHHGIAIDMDLFVSAVVSDPATSYTLTVHSACSLQLARNLVIYISCTGQTQAQ